MRCSARAFSHAAPANWQLARCWARATSAFTRAFSAFTRVLAHHQRVNARLGAPPARLRASWRTTSAFTRVLAHHQRVYARLGALWRGQSERLALFQHVDGAEL